MILVSRKYGKNKAFRKYVACETAVPVIACAACLPIEKENDFFFAGVARSQSVRSPDDGVGPRVDEFFTSSIGGMQTILNTSGYPIFPGTMIEWTFATPAAADSKGITRDRGRTNPRRIGVMKATAADSPRIIGRALSFAKSGGGLCALRAAPAPEPAAFGELLSWACLRREL